MGSLFAIVNDTWSYIRTDVLTVIFALVAISLMILGVRLLVHVIAPDDAEKYPISRRGGSDDN